MQAAVETQRKYKHVLWYSLFVAAYLIVLYLQASAYNSGEVVSTLRQALMPGRLLMAVACNSMSVCGHGAGSARSYTVVGASISLHSPLPPLRQESWYLLVHKHSST